MDKKQFMKDIISIVNVKKRVNSEQFSEIKRDFYLKYNEYYEQQTIKSKLKFYRKYIDKNIKKYSDFDDNISYCEKRDFYSKKIGNSSKKSNEYNNKLDLINLNKIIKIYKSNNSKCEKLVKISKIFSDYLKLWDTYFDLIIPFINTKFIKDLNSIYMFLYNNRNELEFINYYYSIINLNVNYNYAKYIIELYLEENITYNLEDFLNEIGINRKVFDYCIYSIEEFNVDLFNKFIKVKEKNDKLELEYRKNAILDLVNAIKTGYYFDGTEFSVYEFFKRIFFKYERNFGEYLISYVKENNQEYLELIKSFLTNKKLLKKRINKELNVDELLNGYYVYNNVVITKEDKIKVLCYMKDNNIPFFNINFHSILNKYLNGELILKDAKEVPKKKTLAVKS